MPRLSVSRDGTITAIYSDELQDLAAKAESVDIKRASYVEPTEGGMWRVEMADGFVLGTYRYRADALAAEVEYLERKLFRA